MMNFVLLGITLVVAQVVGALIMTAVGLKLMTSKWFMKKYMHWITKMTLDMTDEMMEAFQDKEL